MARGGADTKMCVMRDGTEMLVGTVIRFLWVFGLAVCTMGGCECSGNRKAEDGPQIDRPDLARQIPGAPRPMVVFPADCRQADATVNKFIEHCLDVCARGDYDAYRQLFGVDYRPTSEADFKKVWQGVKGVTVRKVFPRPKDPLHRWYVLAKVELRNPDSKGRQERDVPLMVFKEGDMWRLGPVPREDIEVMRAVASQPGMGLVNQSVGAPASRPATASAPR